MTGHSGAGKSTISKLLSRELGAQHLSEREISRSIAHSQGFSRSRQWVETTGLEEAAVRIREKTVAVIGDYSDRIVIVDGVYDRQLPVDIRQSHATRRMGLIAIEADAKLRVPRCAERMGGVAIELAKRDVIYLDEIKERVGGEELIQAADLTVVNEGNINDAVNEVLDFYRKLSA